MIGGADIILRGASSHDDLDFIRRGLRAFWPAAVYQPVDHTQWLGFGPGAQPGREFFVFRDDQAAMSWRDQGADEGNADLMVHVILEEACTTFVVDQPGSELANAVRDLVRGLHLKRRTFSIEKAA